MNYKHILAAIALVALAGCSKPTIDTSTEESTKSSIEKIKNSLSEEEKVKFEESIKIVTLSNIDFSSFFAPGGLNPNAAKEKINQALQGKNADEIIAQAEGIKKKQEEKEKEQAHSKIKELTEKEAQANKAKLELAKFVVSEARFYKELDVLGLRNPAIELSIENKTTHPISRAYFKGTLATPGRSVPWLEEDFNYEIPGGLEPGEKVKWSLSPNRFSSWGSVDVPPDAVLTVEVVKLDGANKETLFSSTDFTETDAKQLSELKKKYKK